MTQVWDMEAKINKSFEEISRKLFQNSFNYCAEFRVFRCGNTQGASLDDFVKTAIGEQAVVGGATESSRQEVIDALRAALNYRGDHGFHPNLDYLASDASKKDFEFVTRSIQEILERSIRVVSIWLKEGHPFYPVFWDFAFVIETDAESILFIASSSD